MKARKIIAPAVCAAVILTVGYLLQALLVPKYISEAREGNLIAEYYSSPKNHDVIFVGDCEIYENIDPVALYDGYGISSYLRGSPQQLTWMSYCLMEETLKYEKPKAFVFSVLALKYGEPQSEAYNRLAFDGMKLSAAKIRGINASVTEGEDRLSYLLPILRFHSRWSELDANDFRYMLKKKPTVSAAGYVPRIDVKGTDFFPKGQELADYRFSDRCYEYLDKMVKLCRENGVKLIFVKAPSISPYWYDEWEEQVTEYAAKNGIPYYNFLEMQDRTGIDYMTDTYDTGLHLNHAGAGKLTTVLGELLSADLSLTDHRGDKEYDSAWDSIRRFRDGVIEYQKKELAETGKISGITTSLDIG